MVIAGKVVNGRIEIDDVELPEGAEVTVYIEEDLVELTPEEEAEINAALDEEERGEFITGEEMLRRLRERRD